MGCSSSQALSKAGKFYDHDGPPDPSYSIEFKPHTKLKVEKPHRAANKPYVVMGKRYYPMTGDRSFSQTGTASWYGKQFHGRKTAIGERYDMFALTAAHPTMELPSYARVTNLDNGASIIVRVNDRGPFLGGRIIDMSYASAVKLGYHKAGTAKVKVERITRRDIASGNVNLRDSFSDTGSSQENLSATALSTGKSLKEIELETLSSSNQSNTLIADQKNQDSAGASSISDQQADNLPAIASGTVEVNSVAEQPFDAIESLIKEQETSQSPLAWHVQIGAFSDETNAREVAAHAEMMLSENEISAKVHILFDKKLYRVLIGSMTEETIARTFSERIKNLLGVNAFIIQR